MPQKALEKCQAPWGCNYATAKDSGEAARSMYGHKLCRSCYQYAWEQLHELSVSKKESAFKKLPPLRRVPEDKTERCRCGTLLPKGSSSKKRRFIGRMTGEEPIASCRGCYQRAYEFKRDNPSVETMEDAWRLMPDHAYRKVKVH